MRGFTDYFEMYYKLLLPPMTDQKTFRRTGPGWGLTLAVSELRIKSWFRVWVFFGFWVLGASLFGLGAAGL